MMVSGGSDALPALEADLSPQPRAAAEPSDLALPTAGKDGAVPPAATGSPGPG